MQEKVDIVAITLSECPFGSIVNVYVCPDINTGVNLVGIFPLHL